MPRPSSTVRGVPASGIRRIFELAAGHDDVIQLSVGEADRAPAPHVLHAGAQAWLQGRTRYTPNSGITELRTALAEKLLRHNGYQVDPEQVHVTAGGAQALHAALAFTLDPGDEVLVPDPGYTTFTMAARLVGAVPVPYRLEADAGFVPDLTALARLVTARTRAIVLNSPSNPLGVVLDRATMAGLVALAAEHDLWVVSDEVYEYLTYAEGFTSAAAVDPDHRVFGVYSLSKSYALTGARLGYLVAPPGLDERFRAVQEAVVSCVNAPAQWAGLAAVTGPQDHLAEAVAHYRANLDAACATLDARGLRHVRPGGAFYLWIDVRHASGGDVAAWAERLLVEHRVAVAPGTAFGAAGEGWIRVCFAGAQAPLLEALGRLPAGPWAGRAAHLEAVGPHGTATGADKDTYRSS